MKALTLFLIFAFMSLSVIASFAQEFPMVNAIELKGLKRIEEGAIKSKITQKVGEQLSGEKVSNDIKSIFKMGYFDDVKTEVETHEGGVKLVYILKEKPTIIRIEFQGNEEFADDKLKEKVTIAVGSIADTTLIQDNALKIQLFYEEEGYWLAKVIPVINKISENEIYLTYQIEEGTKVRIKKIIVTGDKAISASKIKKAMKTGEWHIFSFLTSSGYYRKDVMAADIESIKDLFFNNGYIKAVVSDPDIKLTDDKKGMNITIQVSEGEQYRISSVAVSGNRALPEAVIRERIATVPGAVFSKEVLRKDIGAITENYTQIGYALANVFPDIVPDDAARKLGLTYKIEEGDIYRIGRIDITGNTKTKDKVIRREVRFDEGDLFNSAQIRRTYERINNLNFFESAELAPRPRYEEKLLDIDIKVKEKPTGFLSIGGGYSSVDKFVGMVDITQGNLFGTGRYIKLRAEIGGVAAFFDFSYRDPWFLDKPLSFFTSIYNMKREYIDYSKKATGGSIGLGKSFGEYWSGNIMYNIENAEIYDVAPTAGSVITEQLGVKLTSSITPTLTRDSRDSYIDPMRGSRNSIVVTVAGLGGDNSFVKGLIDSAWFFPIGSTSIGVRGRVGYATGFAGKELPLYERFCVGGIYTLRGLGYCEAGPKDSTGTLIGGTSEVILNTEFIFPIVSELKLKGVVFFDAGNAYDKDQIDGSLRYTTGLGVRWISPMGPLRIEWGYVLDRQPGEKQSRVEFAFGSFF